MILDAVFIALGLGLLVWSADRFVEGSSITARHMGMSPLLIGMIIVGFGTSAPEMLVSAMSAWGGNSGIALGNAFGSNICNIALILGITAMINPIAVRSVVLKKELPVLTLVTLGMILILSNHFLSRSEAGLLLLVFGGLLVWSLVQSRAHGKDSLGTAVETTLDPPALSLGRAVFRMAAGLGLLMISSRMLVQGAVGIASAAGVDDIFIGLTIVAVGTSLPELASSVAAARRNEHDIALGNIIGSNLFNTLAVVGIAGMIHPMAVEPAVLSRDLPVMTGLTVSLFLVGYGFRGRPGRISRFEGGVLLLSYLGYTGWLIISGT